MISREQLEMNQVWLYALALMIAAGFGLLWPEAGENLNRVISFVLAILMYGMFAQIPFFRLKEALTNRKFIWALIFSAGTRNSLVVLPLALALPEPLNGVASAVIVTQTIVELIGELFYIRLVPNFLLKDRVGDKKTK
ncbi:Uncharacterised protein [Chlamydia abortus]|nr:Uncharacterised protein [Chlamydia abortus]